jgi:flagellar protein FliO/FliZ
MNKRLLYIFSMLLIYPVQVFSDTEGKIENIGTVATGPVEVTAVFQVLAALIFIIILIIAMAWGYKRYGFTSSVNGSLMKVVGAISLGGKEKAVLLQIGDDQVLLGVSPGYVRKIHDIKDPVKPQDNNNSSSFVSRLNIELQKVLGK